MATFSFDTTILPTRSLVDITTGANNLSPFYAGTYQIDYDMSGGATSAGSAKLQISADGVTFADYPGSSIAFTSASTTDIISLTSIDFKFARIVIDVTSGTGGTVTIKAHFLRND